MTTAAEVLKKPLRRMRAEPARGLKADQTDPPIDRKGGDQGAGIIRQAAIVTRGEALGHGYWLDRDFLQSTAAAINARPQGVKSRFTHPGLSSDGLGKFLGRAKNATIDGDVVRADIHFSEMAHKTPDGDLAEYVMGLADEDPEAFGTSIVYMPDWGEEDRFESEHEDEKGRFQSPDPDNAANLPHARLFELWAADVVDEPAANPSGLFHRGQEIAQEADALLSYSLGLSRERPAMTQFDVDPDRVSGFVNRFLESHGLQVVLKSKENVMAKDATAGSQALEAEGSNSQTDSQAESQAETSADAAGETAAGESAATESPDSAGAVSPNELAGETQQSAADPRAELRRFTEAFGVTNGTNWYLEGLSFEAATQKHVEALTAENQSLKTRIEQSQLGEEKPAEFQTADKDAKGKTIGKYSQGQLTDGQAHYAASLKLAGHN